MLLQFDGKDARDCLEGCESARGDGTGDDSDRAVHQVDTHALLGQRDADHVDVLDVVGSTVTLIPTMPGTIRRTLLPGCLDQPGTHIE
ncbi:hypothetical protein [Rhodococcus opacus]|uniref:hypothetical protein n=1 Tax=Rhodococcus opacus TaxID=37919 RepID=UPI0018E0D900|nr:hypothetical protein [Rhodococcus opacus]